MNDQRIHYLKTWPEYFQAILDGHKTFDVRKEDDKGFEIGDILYLKEYLPESEAYTGRHLRRYVSYVLRGPAFGIEENTVVMALLPDITSPHLPNK